ncbi:hypothetical protein OROMI_001620 [Orobanche minor]
MLPLSREDGEKLSLAAELKKLTYGQKSWILSLFSI